jgi:hypothetical protein
MQELYCARCGGPFGLATPRLINQVWYALCPACGVENELEPTVEEPVTSPTFRVLRVMERQQ